jgi:DNA-binding winged helix-turn-helix (wHTH) protein
VASPTRPDVEQAGPYQFGSFVLDPRAGTLTRDGEPVRLPPKPFTLLGYLVERPNVLVTRDELRTVLWGEGTFVDAEEGLAFCLRQLRQALGDQPGSPAYVETVRGRGLRFVHPVVDLAVARARRSSDRRETAPRPPHAPEPATPLATEFPLVDRRVREWRSGRERRRRDRRRGTRPSRWRQLGTVLVGLVLVALAIALLTVACPARPVTVGDQAVAGPRSTAI